MRKISLSTLAAAALTLLASQAHADVVKIDGFRYANPVSLSVSVPTYSGPAGQLSGWLNGNSFLTYCTDLLQFTQIGSTYTDYSVRSIATAFGSAKSTQLDRVVSAFMSTGGPTDAASSAVAQALIWEVLYETGSTFDLGAGSFKVTSGNSQAQNLMTGVNWAAINAAPISYHVDQLYSPTGQDFMVISALAVPEPSSIALVLAAVAGMGVVTRRSRKVPQA